MPISNETDARTYRFLRLHPLHLQGRALAYPVRSVNRSGVVEMQGFPSEKYPTGKPRACGDAA